MVLKLLKVKRNNMQKKTKKVHKMPSGKTMKDDDMKKGYHKLGTAGSKWRYKVTGGRMT